MSCGRRCGQGVGSTKETLAPPSLHRSTGSYPDDESPTAPRHAIMSTFHARKNDLSCCERLIASQMPRPVVRAIGDGLAVSKKVGIYPWLDVNAQGGRVDVEVGINAALADFGLE